MMWSSQRIRTRGMKMGLLRGKGVSRGKHTLTLFGDGLLGKKEIINGTIRSLELCRWQRHSVWLQGILIGVRKTSRMSFPVRKNDKVRFSLSEFGSSCWENCRQWMN